jgi:hypothetical protein
MLLVRINFLIPLLLGAQLATSALISKATIAGTWDCISLTALEKGKPSGTVRFNARNVVFTYGEDDSWQMESNLSHTHTKLNGKFELHENELILKKADGSVYQDFRIDLKDDGKTLTMKDVGSIISASKVESTLKNP